MKLAHYLDTNFLSQKVERIKFLTDLHRRISYFDAHIQNATHHEHLINPIGIHLIDKEIDEKFS